MGRLQPEGRRREVDVLLQSRGKIYKLWDALAPLTGYEHVFFDTPPALNGLLEVVEEVKQDHNPGLKVAGIVVK